MPQVPLFTAVKGFTDALDVVDPLPPVNDVGVIPKPSTAQDGLIMHQIIGYRTTGQPGIGASADFTTATLWTKREFAGGPGVNLLTPAATGNVSQALAANGAQYHTHAVGWMSSVRGEVHPALFTHHGTTLLAGVTGTGGASGGTQGQAHSVTNPVNQVIRIAGWVTDAAGVHLPVVWSVPIDANNLALGMQQSIVQILTAEGEALDLHDNGQVVGWFRTPSGQPHAFLLTAAGTQIDLGTLGGARSVAYACGADGTVVGASDTASGEMHAFRWKAGATTGPPSNPEMTDLGSWAGESAAFDVNDHGVVVGWSLTSSGEQRAAYWVQDLIGSVGTLATVKTSRILHDVTGGWVFLCANAINNDGHIVGLGVTPTGEYGAWRTVYRLVQNPALQQLDHLFSSVFKIIGSVPADGPGFGIPLSGAPPVPIPPRPPASADIQELAQRGRELIARLRL